jgi:hypothetical protein
MLKNALLKQQLVHAQAEKSLQQSLLAAQGAALAAKDGELQALRALASVQAACGSAGAVSCTKSCDVQCKRARVVDDSSLRSPLDKDELLDAVFSYVGAGDYFYAAGVCRRWKGRYIKLCYNKVAADKADKLCTTVRSTCVSAARLQLAFDSGLQVDKLHNCAQLASDIAKYSIDPIEALIVAKTYDMRYPAGLTSEAAFYGRLQSLQWLHERRCTWEEGSILICAAGSGLIDMLTWLQTVTAPWSEATQCQMLLCASMHDRLDAVKWMRHTANMPWPYRLRAASIIDLASYSQDHYSKRVAS